MTSKNPNHPKKGSLIIVEPIKKLKDLKLIKKNLADNPRDLAIFVLGINTNLRASDILKIKVDQVIDVKAEGEILLKEKKTKKNRRITLNKNVVDAIQAHIERMKTDKRFNIEGPLFLSQRGEKALSVVALSRLVKKWCKDANLKGNFASHTLRKSWGFHQRVTFKMEIPKLMECLNHSSQKQTLDYLCIQDEEIKDIYLNEL